MASRGSVLKNPILAPSKFGQTPTAEANKKDKEADQGDDTAVPEAKRPKFHGLLKESKLSSVVAKTSSPAKTEQNNPFASAKESCEGDRQKNLFLPLVDKEEGKEKMSDGQGGKSEAADKDREVSAGEARLFGDAQKEEKAKENQTSSTPSNSNLFLSASSSASSTAIASAKSPDTVCGGGGASTLSATNSSSSSSGGFVFGQNLSDRVENVPKSEDVAAGPPADVGSPSADKDKVGKTLSEAAAEYCETSQAQKRKYEEVKVVTGEEDERNVVQFHAKLHVYDKDKSGWVERGRGLLRLNDDETKSSRLVMRTAGSLRVILNSPLFPGMTLERPTEKMVRLAGRDGEGAVKIFLVTGAAKDAQRLYTAMEKRLEVIAAAAKNEEGTQEKKLKEEETND